jgi:hypothetical protein
MRAFEQQWDGIGHQPKWEFRRLRSPRQLLTCLGAGRAGRKAHSFANCCRD